ncbi:MAG TPA: hypothetical protein DCE42_16665 [Myxococcales bacterium]|nr:hypothetical protein [Deltaproteobacteria bacterium]MBU48317.1 hypothetical protein [Deltaproteobacteria bacterium]HAA56400.1 hypothetical protein [Myxococcales bacterium]
MLTYNRCTSINRLLSPCLVPLIFLCGIVTWCVCLPSLSFADERVNPIEGTSETSSDYSLISNEIPGMVIVLTNSQIRVRGYRTVYEILRDLPGFTTRGAFGESPISVIMDGEQSQGNEKFLLYIDGVLEQDLWRRSVWLSTQYSVAAIKNITVFYGAAATRFGANALSGVIFIDTKKAEDLGDGYGDISITKDVRTNMWAVDFMLGHSYNKRNNPKLAKSLFSWYLRGRLYLSEERDPSLDSRWTLADPDVQAFIQKRVDDYCDDYKRAYGIKDDGCTNTQVKAALDKYRQQLLGEFLDDASKSGLFAKPIHRNQNNSFAVETGLRFDNWFLRFFLWNMSTGPGLRYPSFLHQTEHQWTVRNLSLSLHHLKSELWSSGVGEKAQVIYFNLNMYFQRHEIPSSSLRVTFSPQTRVFYGRTCKDPTGANDIPCTWKEYTWTPTYHYVVSNSFRAQPKLDFRLLEGNFKFSIGFDTGASFLQGNYVTSNRESPELYAEPQNQRGAGNQFEHTFFSAFFQSELTFSKIFVANIGLRSDWELVRGNLEVVPNCQRPLTPCYRYSSPLVGRGSLIFKPSKRFQARLSYGYAFLSPSNWQLYGNSLADPNNQNIRDLLPQDKHALELNLFFQPLSKLFVTMSVFHNWLFNVNAIVVLPYRQNENRNFNIGNQTTIGGRFYAFYKLFKWLDIVANFAILLPRLDVVNDNSDESILLEDVPFFQGNLIADFRSGPSDMSHFFGSVRMNVQTARTNTGFDQLENGQIQVVRGAQTDTQFVLHLSAGYMWVAPEGFPVLKRLHGSFVMENLLNTTYYDLGIRSGRSPNYSPLVQQPGINAYFNLSASF